jgi:hypothetical protein
MPDVFSSMSTNPYYRAVRDDPEGYADDLAYRHGLKLFHGDHDMANDWADHMWRDYLRDAHELIDDDIAEEFRRHLDLGPDHWGISDEEVY